MTGTANEKALGTAGLWRRWRGKRLAVLSVALTSGAIAGTAAGFSIAASDTLPCSDSVGPVEQVTGAGVDTSNYAYEFTIETRQNLQITWSTEPGTFETAVSGRGGDHYFAGLSIMGPGFARLSESDAGLTVPCVALALPATIDMDSPIVLASDDVLPSLDTIAPGDALEWRGTNDDLGVTALWSAVVRSKEDSSTPTRLSVEFTATLTGDEWALHSTGVTALVIDAGVPIPESVSLISVIEEAGHPSSVSEIEVWRAP